MFLVTHRDAAAILAPLMRACARRGAAYACFFSGDGVAVLDDERVRQMLPIARKAIACEVSWERYRHGADCPVHLGSQTNNSALMAEAGHVISL